MKKTNISERLKLAMQARNLTQGALAKAAGVAQPTIWRLTSGKATESKKALDIANALGVSVDWLVNGMGEMTGGSVGLAKTVDAPQELPGSFIVDIFENEKRTGAVVIVPDAVKSKTCRAYILNKNSGCSDAPAGTTIVVDADESPGTGDLVYAKVNNNLSVYRFLDGGSSGFLAVDDERIPLVDVSSSAEILGVIVFLLRDLKRKK